MSITDELRRVAAKTECANGRCEKLYRGDLDHIADRIDAEHERVVRERRRSCVYYDPERHYCSYHDFDVSGYVELPKDADGEYIHVGDAVTCGATVWTVTGLKFLGEGWGICCTVYNEYGGSGTNVYPPSDLRHYHAPTVEDVLTEMADRIYADEDEPRDRDAIVAEYAQRLQLREVDE